MAELLKEFILKEFSGEGKWVLEAICGTSQINEELENSPEFKNLLHIVGSIIAKELISITKELKRNLKEIQAYYTCIYKFTKKKFEILSQSKIFGILFKYFVNHGKFDEMTLTDKTLMRNPEKYTEGAHKIVKVFERRANI